MIASSHPSVRFRRSLEALGRAASPRDDLEELRAAEERDALDLEDLIAAGNRLARLLDAGRRGTPAPPQSVSAAVRRWDEARDRFA